MNIEDRIRSRIEAILMNDARNYAEIRGMAEGEEPIHEDSFEEERNLYQRRKLVYGCNRVVLTWHEIRERRAKVRSVKSGVVLYPSPVLHVGVRSEWQINEVP